MARKKIVHEPFSVKVEIECCEIVMYKQTVMMRQSDYEKIKDMDGYVSGRDEPEAYSVIQNYIDPRDVYDSPDSEYLGVQVNQVED